MTPVQHQVLSLPDLAQDCLVQAKTGTGKTVAFLLPTLHALLTSQHVPAGKVGILVIAPTRELAAQIGDECNKLTAFCHPRVECHLAYGGIRKNANLDRFLQGKPSVLVATPGRLLDYLEDQAVRVKFTHLRSLVLDEADRLLDPGFIVDMKKILQLIPSKQELGWQGMCFSATMPPAVQTMLHHVLKPGYQHISTVSETEAPTVDKIPQSVQIAATDSLLPTLHNLLACEQLDTPDLKAVIFAPTARYAGLLYDLFTQPGVSPGNLPVHQMHSRMSQALRNKSIEAFKPAPRGLLFASDVVGRGMDFADVGLVVQVSAPMDKEQYVHRVGRTGRAGKGGRAVMILMPEEQGFVARNPQFPIQTTPRIHDKAFTILSQAIVQQALANVSDVSKERAYVAFLGYFTSSKNIKMPLVDMVKLANRFSEALGCEEPPAIEPKVIGKMGYKGVPGLRKKTQRVEPAPQTQAQQPKGRGQGQEAAAPARHRRR